MIITAEHIVETLRKAGLTISAAESCTGGGLANALTNVSGASKVFKGSYVTYSNEAKIRLGVAKEAIDLYSVYSHDVAFEMAFASADAAEADIGVGITGNFAEVDPANPEASKMGTVFIALVYQHGGFPKYRKGTLKVGTKMDRASAKDRVLEKTFRMIQEIVS